MFAKIGGVRVAGITSCVPKKVADNYGSQLLGGAEESEKFIKTTGIRYRRVVEADTCTSDLAVKAAEKLFSSLDWQKEDIELLIMVTQTPDFTCPNTAIILQDRLGLPKSCIAFDVPLGCSGYVYGLFIATSMMNSAGLTKGLLIVGDTLSRQASPLDKSAFPLFGDGASATALEATDKDHKINFLLGSDGSGYEAIIVPGSGYREPLTAKSLEYTDIEPGISRTRLNTVMNGTDVFSFGISVVPAELKKFCELSNQEISSFDHVFFHQANFFMNEKIRKKAGLSEEQVPYSLHEYGNTSSATIPITISHHYKNAGIVDGKNILLCGFGVGLSWGTCSFKTSGLVVTEIVEY